MEKLLIWCSSVLMAVATAVAFLFLTFQTSAQADKINSYFDSRLERMEQKIDQLIRLNK